LRLPRDAVTVPLVRTICRDAMSRLGVTPDCQGDVALDQDSGRGIVLMRLMVDRIGFESRPEDGTVVHLQKHLELEENAFLATL
jgi:hypothetical protein